MDAAKMMMTGKEDFDRDNEKHNAFNNTSKKRSYGLWVIRHHLKVIVNIYRAVR